MPRIVITLHLGPMVKIDIEGASCEEITGALTGFEALNGTIDGMFSDLARRVFPEGVSLGEDEAS